MMFSFVIPVYNTEAFLPRCLDSIRAQTDSDYEIIVADDCSPGNCAEVLKPYGDAVRHVRHETNRSAFQARCTGVCAAKGDYIVPVDPDDYVMPELLARLRATLASETADVVSYWMEYDDGRRITPHWCRHASGSMSGSEAVRELADRKLFTGVASKAIRRSVWLEVLDALPIAKDAYVNTSDDYLVLMPALLTSRRVAFLDYVGYRYFVNPESTTGGWQTPEGLRRGCEQTRLVVDAVEALAAKLAGADPAVLADVRRSTAGLERFFTRLVLDGPTSKLGASVEVLSACFRSDSVAAELVDEIVSLRSARSYRIARKLARLRNVLSGSRR